MVDLVVLNKGESFCDSRLVAEKFGKKHLEVVRVIKGLEKDFDNLRATSNRPKIIERVGEYRGQTFTYYEMDRKFFSLLAMRFKGKKAFEWQNKFNDAFYEMEKILIQTASNQQNEMWLAQREQAKLVRKQETDVIKEFVEYATNQGSTQAKYYYKHITTACYKCLDLVQHERPELRSTLDMMQTSQLILAEKVASKSLRKYMDKGEHYKAIFALVKQDLDNFANSFLLVSREAT
jgi:Rha family phage regulatory protein